MTKQEMIETLTAAGWQNLDDSWTEDELRELVEATQRAERMAQDAEDR